MSSGLQRVSFRFGRETEVRYLAQVPEIGDHVTHGTAIWVNSEVRTDGVGAFVTCELPPPMPDA